jgi:FtsP/CotA-like multicopper oxidase with cupredoxin domain
MRSHPKLLCTALLLGMALGPRERARTYSTPRHSPSTWTRSRSPADADGGPNYYEIGAWQIQQRLHAQLPLTTVWGYGSTQATASYPAATIEARRGVPIDIHWTNHLPMTHLLSYAIDPTLMKAYTTTAFP